jgi:hypothetical protein
MKKQPIMGKVDAILRSNGKLEAGADYRGDDSAAGFLAITGAYFKISYIFYQNSFSSKEFTKALKVYSAQNNE